MSAACQEDGRTKLIPCPILTCWQSARRASPARLGSRLRRRWYRRDGRLFAGGLFAPHL